jgi:hypothetical protein
MEIKEAIRLMIDKINDEYDQGELEEDEPELSEAIKTGEAFIVK